MIRLSYFSHLLWALNRRAAGRILQPVVIVHCQQCGKREHSSPFPWSALVLWFHIIVPCLSFPWFVALTFVVNVTVVVFPSCRCMTILRRCGEYFSLASV